MDVKSTEPVRKSFSILKKALGRILVVSNRLPVTGIEGKNIWTWMLSIWSSREGGKRRRKMELQDEFWWFGCRYVQEMAYPHQA
jgi:hypothetical protein